MSFDLLNIRARVVDYLRRELMGPRGGEMEELPEEPYRRYSTGILYPREAAAEPMIDEDAEETTGTAGGTGSGDSHGDQGDEPVALANQHLPASMAISFFVRGQPGLHVRVTAGHYVKVEHEVTPAAGKKRAKTEVTWQRRSLCEPVEGEFLLIQPGMYGRMEPVSIFGGAAELHALWREAASGWLVTVSVVNARRTHQDKGTNADDCLHQVELRCRPAQHANIARYPRPRLITDDREEHILDLLYRNRTAYGVGHGCSVSWEEPRNGTTAEIRTEFIPEQSVRPIAYELPGYERVLDLQFLADGIEGAGESFFSELRRFVEGYRIWIASLPGQHQDIPSDLNHAKNQLLERLNRAAERMEAGVALLEADDTVRDAFCLANRAMLLQMVHTTEDYAGTRRAANESMYRAPQLPLKTPRRWRPFQLAFQLLTLSSVADADDAARSVVDLIWFPTGGGKTEAYLAVTAFLIFYRRMMHGAAGAGTAVMMRYTLRLLTTQQFRRAATLICACELLRRDDELRIPGGEITIGLWVGMNTTPNTYLKAQEEYLKVLESDEPRHPFQLDWCPWCGTELVPQRKSEDRGVYGMHSTISSFRLYCPSKSCPFHDKLPAAVVDEQLYDRPPTLLLGTVDKFARMPWEERSSRFFGGTNERPPELIIQDELHLISGPLGTIVGVYETAVDALTSWNGVRPKILASTATIRRADEQCMGLYARSVELFPPSGLSAEDSYFARYDDSRPGRLYLGVLAPGHTGSTAMIRTSAALLQAPIELGLQGEERDAYWTLVAYHNSLRELGKVRTFAADDIPARLKVITDGAGEPRDLDEDSVQELTGGIPADRLSNMLERMEVKGDQPGSLSLVLCTNMLSVGVDVQRLGLMLVNGQPKSTSEYIQATSRVGRGKVPGLVVCLYSSTKPRDRSHYERFVTYHQALYRQVEPTSVTPFAPPARDRALHAVMVTLVRFKSGLSGQDAAGQFRQDLPSVERIIQIIEERVAKIDSEEATAAAQQIRRLLEEWEGRAEELSRQLSYHSTQRQKPVLMRDIGDKDHAEGWLTLQSMRNVDQSCLIDIMGA